MHDRILEVHIFPSKPHQFASPQSGKGIQLDHRAERVRHFFQNRCDLVRRENVWRPLSVDG
jgi:hypothetical protein